MRGGSWLKIPFGHYIRNYKTLLSHFTRCDPHFTRSRVKLVANLVNIGHPLDWQDEEKILEGQYCYSQYSSILSGCCVLHFVLYLGNPVQGHLVHILFDGHMLGDSPPGHRFRSISICARRGSKKQTLKHTTPMSKRWVLGGVEERDILLGLFSCVVCPGVAGTASPGCYSIGLCSGRPERWF